MGELIGGIQQGVQSTGNDLENTGAEFRELAGSSRTFESAGGAGVLDRAISPSTPSGDRAGATDDALGFLGASYQGPAGLDATSSGNLGRQYEDLGTLSSSLGTGGGYQAVLRAANPGLTPGEAQYDAARAFQDTSWREPVRNVQSAVGTATNAYNTAEQGAQDYAKQRTGEESDIANFSRDYLKGSQDSIWGDMNQKYEAGVSQNEQIGQTFNELRNTPMTGTQAAQQGLAENYSNPILQKQNEGRGKFDEIMGSQKYTGIADIPLMGAGVDWNTGSPSNYAVTNPDGSKRALSVPEKQLVEQRQKELMDSFGSIEAFTPFEAARDAERRAVGQPAWYDGMDSGSYENRGQYGDVLPLRFGDPYTEGNVNDFLTMNPGSGTPNVQQFASEDQRYSIGQIDSLLGQVKSLGETSPFEAASIAVDLDQYLRSEEQRLNASGNASDAEAQKYLSGLKVPINDLKKWLNQNPQVGAIATVLSAGGN